MEQNETLKEKIGPGGGGSLSPKINHRGTETQRFHREEPECQKDLPCFSAFSVKPLCLCTSVVDLGRRHRTKVYEIGTMGTKILRSSRARRKVRIRKVIRQVCEVVRTAPNDELALLALITRP